MSPEPRVRLRCGKRGCSRILAELYAPEDFEEALDAAKSVSEFGERLARVRRIATHPPDWAGNLRVQPCPRHDKPRRQFAQEAMARVGAGYDPRPVWTYHDVLWTDLAPAFRLATDRGKTTEETLTT